MKNASIFRRASFSSAHSKLTIKEIEKLRKMNLGYGNFAANAARCRMHPNTYRYIIDRGHGLKKNINVIRAVLLPNNESHTHQLHEDRAGQADQGTG